MGSKSSAMDRIHRRMRTAKTYTAESTQRVLASKYKLLGGYFNRGISQRRVEEFVSSRLESGIAPSTVNYELSCLRSIIKPEDHVNLRLVRDRRRHGRVYLTPEETTALMAKLDKPIRRMALAYLFTGARLEELRSVKEADTTVRPGFLRLHNQKTSHTGYDHTRFVPLGERVKGLLPLDLSISPATYRRALERAAKKAGLEISVTPKTFRSTYASTLAQNGVPMETIQELLGHASSVITHKHYAHLAPRQLVDAVKHLPQQLLAPRAGDCNTVDAQ